MYRKHTVKKQMGTILCLVAMTGLVAVGCAKQQTGGIGDATNKEAVSPLKVKMMIPYWNPEPPKQDTDPMKKIQEYTQSKLEIMWTCISRCQQRCRLG
jgi:putative aldouronate transport system substrate-binding protein